MNYINNNKIKFKHFFSLEEMVQMFDKSAFVLIYRELSSVDLTE